MYHILDQSPAPGSHQIWSGLLSCYSYNHPWGKCQCPESRRHGDISQHPEIESPPKCRCLGSTAGSCSLHRIPRTWVPSFPGCEGIYSRAAWPQSRTHQRRAGTALWCYQRSCRCPWSVQRLKKRNLEGYTKNGTVKVSYSVLWSALWRQF